MKRIAMLLLASLTAACSTPIPPAALSPAPVSAPAPARLAQPQVVLTVAALVVPPESPMQLFERMRDATANKSIYFDYDRYAIKSDETSLIIEHAKLANAFPRDHLTLQGNCDERGGSEYNLALGQRRADAVKEQLVMLGIPAARIETVSFGKEKPRERCHEERCWAENRRADFVDAWK
jgi:peptidoglycan-associated lipoprotein